MYSARASSWADLPVLGAEDILNVCLCRNPGRGSEPCPKQNSVLTEVAKLTTRHGCHVIIKKKTFAEF